MDQEPIQEPQQIQESKEKNKQVNYGIEQTKHAGNLLSQCFHNLKDKTLSQNFKTYYSDKRKQINNVELINIALKSQDYPQFLITNTLAILNEIIVQNIEIDIFNQILLLIERDKVAYLIDKYKIQNLVKQHHNILQYDSLQLLDQVFELQLPENFWEKRFQKCIHTKQFKLAFKVYQEHNLKQDKFNELIDYLNNRSNCSLAVQFIKKLQIPLSQYPQIQRQQYRNAVSYFISQYPLCKVEELMKQEKGVLLELVQHLDNKNKHNDAASIIKRQNLLPLIEDKQLLQFYSYYVNNPDYKEEPNILFEQDYFGPSENIFAKKPQYLRSSELGYQEFQITYFDHFNEFHKSVWEEILKSEYIALDCEYTCNLVSTDNSDTVLQLLQIANDKQAYVIDLFALQNNDEFLNVLKRFLSSEMLVIGLGVNQDIELLEKYSKCQNNLKIYEIAKEFKKANIIDSNKSNLAFITETILGKPLSKFEQMSDWVSRPIRKCQLHYAAMDAIVCIKIYQILKNKKYQSQYIEKAQDENKIQQSQEQQQDSHESTNFLEEIRQLVQQNQYDKAFELIKKSDQNQGKSFKVLVDSINSHDFKMLKQARLYLNELNLDIKEYPILYEDELFVIARTIKNRPLQYIKERVGNNPDLIIKIVSQYYYNRERDFDAATLLQDYNLLNRIKDEKMHQYYRKIIKKQNYQFNKKMFQSQDRFDNESNQFQGPNYFDEYLTMQVLGYQAKQVVLVDQSGQELVQAWQHIGESQMIGIDCQFGTGIQNNVQDIHFQTIQIATSQLVFIFNLFTIDLNEFCQYLDSYLSNTKSKIIGYQTLIIIKQINTQFGIQESNQLQIYELESICRELKIQNKDLGSLAKVILNKQIKNSNSQIFIKYRPLSDEEVDLLGLKAIACLKIYENLILKYGEKIVEESSKLKKNDEIAK